MGLFGWLQGRQTRANTARLARYDYAGPCVNCGKALYQDTIDPQLGWFDLSDPFESNVVCRETVFKNQRQTWLHTADPKAVTVFSEGMEYDLPSGLTEEEVEAWLSE